MNINNARLELLLKTLEITPKALSNAIHVDYSLISKWKSGKRKLAAKSPHFINIINYILDVCHPALYEKMRELSIVSKDSSTLPDTQVRERLVAWLETADDASGVLSMNEKDNSYAAVYNVYMNNCGKRIAIMRLLDEALSLPDNQTIYILSYEDRSWLFEDNKFLEAYTHKMLQLIEKNCIIHFVRVLESYSIHEIFSLENDLFLKYPNNIQNWYIPNYSGMIVNSSLHILKEHAAILSFSCTPYASSYSFFIDPYTVELYSKIFASLISKSKKLLSPLTLSVLQSFLARMDQTLYKSKNSIRVYKKGISMFLFPRETLIQILNENEIFGEVAKEICSVYDRLSNFTEEVDTKIIFSHEFLDQQSRNETIYVYDLSIFLNKTIYVTQAQLASYLRNILIYLNRYPKFELGFLTPDDPTYYQDINVAIFENSVLLISNVSNLPLKGSMTAEPLFVHEYYNIYQQIWSRISMPLRHKTNVTQIIELLIKKIE